MDLGDFESMSTIKALWQFSSSACAVTACCSKVNVTSAVSGANVTADQCMYFHYYESKLIYFDGDTNLFPAVRCTQSHFTYPCALTISQK